MVQFYTLSNQSLFGLRRLYRIKFNGFSLKHCKQNTKTTKMTILLLKIFIQPCLLHCSWLMCHIQLWKTKLLFINISTVTPQQVEAYYARMKIHRKTKNENKNFKSKIIICEFYYLYRLISFKCIIIIVPHNNYYFQIPFNQRRLKHTF